MQMIRHNYEIRNRHARKFSVHGDKGCFNHFSIVRKGRTRLLANEFGKNFLSSFNGKRYEKEFHSSIFDFQLHAIGIIRKCGFLCKAA